MSNKLQLNVVLTALDKATAPLKRIQTGSIGAGRALKEARDNLKALNNQQRDVSALKAQRSAVMASEQQLAKAQQTLRTLREELKRTQSPTAQFQQRFIKASQAVQQLTHKHQQQRSELQKVIGKLTQAGIGTRDLGQSEDTLRSKIAATNQVIKQQETRLSRITAQQKRLSQAKASYEKSQGLAGSMAGSGAAGLASGYAMAKPLKGIVDAFAPNENAATQLKVSMMDENGAVSADFQRITDLATGLGDRLPGTTADFQEMMTMLRRQGMSAQSILGGTGEAAAYLGVQLNKPVAEAAEFAAKMQDATRTSEADMMGLMDTIQRAFYLGVDDNNMLQGFTKLSPVMSILKKEGLQATSALAPLLVMMDQTGMAGESAGNAIRKVFQAGMNQNKFDDANDLLKHYQAGFSLDFTNGKGEFGGIDNLFAQLKKFESLNTVQRTSVMQAMFGDDAETLQVVNTLMSKGVAGYQEVAGKMQSQADLNARVTEQLGTLANVTEAAQGSWTNTLAQIGEIVAPELKAFINQLGELAVTIKDWVKANPQLTATIFKTVAGLALLLAIGGGLTLMFASVLGPMAMVRYGMSLLGIKSLGVFKPLLRLGKVALPAVVKGLRLLSIAALTNPILLLLAGIVIGAILIYAYWDEIGAFFTGLWEEIKQGFSGGIGSIISTILDFTPVGLFYRAFAKVLEYLGIELPAKFSDFGKMMIGGIVNGIKSGIGWLKETISGVADTSQQQYRKDMAIHSPSRVFAELGNHTMAGLNQGLVEGESDVLRQVAATAEAMAARPPVRPKHPQPSAMESALGSVAGGIRNITDLGAGMLGLPSNAELNRPQAKAAIPAQAKPASGLQDLLSSVAGQVRQITDAGAGMLGLPSNAELNRPQVKAPIPALTQAKPASGLQGVRSSVAGQVRQLTDAGAGMLGLPSNAELNPPQAKAAIPALTQAKPASGLQGVLSSVAGQVRQLTDAGASMLGLPSNAELNRPQAKVPVPALTQAKPASGLQGVLSSLAGQVRQLTDAGAGMLGLPSNAELNRPQAKAPFPALTQAKPASGLQGVLSSVAGQVRQLTDAGAGVLGLPNQQQLKTLHSRFSAAPANLATDAGISFERRPPIASASSTPLVIQGDTITINLSTPAGTDTAALRRLLNQLLDERERNKTARIRSRLSDND